MDPGQDLIEHRRQESRSAPGNLGAQAEHRVNLCANCPEVLLGAHRRKGKRVCKEVLRIESPPTYVCACARSCDPRPDRRGAEVGIKDLRENPRRVDFEDWKLRRHDASITLAVS